MICYDRIDVSEWIDAIRQANQKTGIFVIIEFF